MKEQLQRLLAGPSRAFARSRRMKLVLAGGLLLLIGLLVAFSVRSPNLGHVHVGVLSGDPQKHYHTVVDGVAAEARLQRGRIDNIPSAGSVENISRLIAGRAACEVHFALVQEGLEWPAGSSLELVGRLPRAESLVFLGRQADRIKTLKDLHGMRIGVGPIGSGTEHVARQVLSPLTELGLVLSTHDIEEQLVKLERGELELGAMVVDEDAELLATAVRDRGLQILNLPNAEALARRLPFKRVGRIVVGQYDPVRVLPGEAKDLLQVDTLIVGNGCARRSVTQGFITVVLAGFPDFVRYNRDTPNRSGLPLAPAARSYFEQGGPDLVGVYAPWVIDIMPTASWVQLILGISLIFNAKSLLNRFYLSRLDADRMRTESAMSSVFGPTITVQEIAELVPSDKHRTPGARKQLDTIVDQFTTQLEQSRRASRSVLVPMGEALSYHDVEEDIAELLHAVRKFRDRLGTGS